MTGDFLANDCGFFSAVDVVVVDAVVVVVVVDAVVVVVVVDARLFGTCVRKLFGPRRNKMPKVLLIDFFHE